VEATRLDDRSMSRAVLVLPLVEGAKKRVAELLRKGPPFDPEEVGLGRHQVFLTESEAVFLFEATSAEAAERLLSSSGVWTAAAAWKDLVAGPAAARRRRLLVGSGKAGRPFVVRGDSRAGRQRRRRRLLSL
jgi:hypothetical protein